MLRHQYIYNQVLQLYKTLDSIVFPIDIDAIFKSIPDCRTLTYQEFARINTCTIDDVFVLCESKTGCTHYDITNNRYLILWNANSADNNVLGRMRWTKAHEIGHVILKHLPYIATQKLAENGFSNLTTPELEKEADMFAATFLSPIPLFDTLNIGSPSDVQTTFGLSMEASLNRWTAYCNWKESHRRFAWENDIRRLYRNSN